MLRNEAEGMGRGQDLCRYLLCPSHKIVYLAAVGALKGYLAGVGHTCIRICILG